MWISLFSSSQLQNNTVLVASPNVTHHTVKMSPLKQQRLCGRTGTAGPHPNFLLVWKCERKAWIFPSADYFLHIPTHRSKSGVLLDNLRHLSRLLRFAVNGETKWRWLHTMRQFKAHSCCLVSHLHHKRPIL